MPSSVTSHTVPPFYSVYFLRSISGPCKTYIGSTPSPPRRKRQHNGELTQGAKKTCKSRPWEIECIVFGFSSKIAALQFEWAWSKPHLSRHLKTTTISLFPSKKSNPNTTLLVLRALLQSEPFSSWGLQLEFFTEWSWLSFLYLDRQRIQNRLPPLSVSRNQRQLHPDYPLLVCDFYGVDGKRSPISLLSSQQQQKEIGLLVGEPPSKSSFSMVKNSLNWPETLPTGANIKSLRMSINDIKLAPLHSPSSPTTTTTTTTSSANRIQFNDTQLSQLEWSRFQHFLTLHSITTTHHLVTCNLCTQSINFSDHLSFTFCPLFSCHSIFHLPCLATHFLLNSTQDFLLPTHGSCPSSCSVSIAFWSDIIRLIFRRKEKFEKQNCIIQSPLDPNLSSSSSDSDVILLEIRNKFDIIDLT